MVVSKTDPDLKRIAAPKFTAGSGANKANRFNSDNTDRTLIRLERILGHSALSLRMWDLNSTFPSAFTLLTQWQYSLGFTNTRWVLFVDTSTYFTEEQRLFTLQSISSRKHG